MNGISAVAACLAAVFAVLCYIRIATLERRVATLSQLNAKLDALLTGAGVAFDPFTQVPPAVADALRRGDKIEAIKRYKESTGADLKAAKEYVEEVQRRAGIPA